MIASRLDLALVSCQKLEWTSVHNMLGERFCTWEVQGAYVCRLLDHVYDSDARCPVEATLESIGCHQSHSAESYVTGFETCFFMWGCQREDPYL